MADPVAQIFQQAAFPAGESRADVFFKGRTRAANEAATALAKSIAEQDLAMKRFELDEALRLRSDAVSNEAALSDLSRYMSQVISGGGAGDPANMAPLLDTLARNPKLRNDPRAVSLFKDYQWAAEQAIAAKQFATEVELRGRAIDVDTMRALQGPTDTPTTQMKNAAAVANARAALRDAEASGDANRIAAARESLTLLEEQTARPGEVTTINDPNTGMPLVSIRRGGSGKGALESGELTTPNVTKLQENLRVNMDAISLANDIIPNIGRDSVGAVGNVSEFVFDEILPQLGFNTADVQRMDTRTKMRNFAASMVKALTRPDSRISDADRRILGAIPPDPEKWNMSSDKAVSDMLTLRRLTAKNAIRDAAQLKQTIPTPLFNAVTGDDVNELFRDGYLQPINIKNLFQSGFLSQEQAEKILTQSQ